MSENYLSKRSLVIKGLIISTLTIIFLRVAFLQIFHGEYLDIANNQAVELIVNYPARGVILDRNGLPFLYNETRYDLTILPKTLQKERFDTLGFCSKIGMDTAVFNSKMKKMIVKNGWHVRGALLKELSINDIIPYQSVISQYPSIEIKERSVRQNKYGVGGILLGYLGEVSKEDLKKEFYKGFQMGDYVGINGLEKEYEDLLRGQRGLNHVLRDSKGKIQGSFNNGKDDKPPVRGKDLQLTVDLSLQELGENLMSGKLGSVVAIDPRDGGILALVSAPTYNPNDLIGPMRSENFNSIYLDATKPLFNRAVLAMYPPGSTFKPLSALVGLDLDVISPQYGFGCSGGYGLCGHRIGCTHSGGGHASNLRLAIANSCNSYFCHVYRLSVDAPQFNGDVKKGMNEWRKYMNSFGLGRKLGIDLPVENSGYIPGAEEYDRKYKGQKWNSCSGAMMGMGQGDVTVTPLQMANAMCIIANKGFFYTPHLVKNIDNDSTHELLKPYTIKHQVAHIDDNSFSIVQLGMQDVVTHGTARIAQIPNIDVCGKTGTVENYALINGRKTKLANHSFFVAFAPRVNPTIAICVVVENSGYGATWAGPIASLMIEQWLTGSISEKRKHLVSRMNTARIVPNYIYTLDAQQRAKAIELDKKKDSINNSYFTNFNNLYLNASN